MYELTFLCEAKKLYQIFDHLSYYGEIMYMAVEWDEKLPGFWYIWRFAHYMDTYRNHIENPYVRCMLSEYIREDNIGKWLIALSRIKAKRISIERM